MRKSLLLAILFTLLSIICIASIVQTWKHERETTSLFIVQNPGQDIVYLRFPVTPINPTGDWKRLTHLIDVDEFIGAMREAGHTLAYAERVRPHEQVPSTWTILPIAILLGNKEGIFVGEARNVFGLKRPMWGDEDVRREVTYLLWETP